MHVISREQNDIEIARQGPVLESVIEKVHLRAQLVLCVESSPVAAFANEYRTAQAVRDEQRLIAKLFRQPIWIHFQHATAAATIAARKNIERDTALREQFSQQHYKRSFA